MTLLTRTGVALKLSTFGLLTCLALFLALGLDLAMSNMAMAGPTYSVTKLNDDTYLTYGVGANQLEAKVSAVRHALEFATGTTLYAETRLVDGQMSSASSAQMNALIASLSITKLENRDSEVYLEARVRLTNDDFSILQSEGLFPGSERESFVQPNQDGSLISKGIGATKHLARQAAIRNALAYQVDQLVISQQVMDSYRLTKDIFISSMSGHITKVELMGYRRLEDGDHLARLNVFVNEGGIQESIEQFASAFGVVGSTAGATQFDTDDIATQLLSAELEQDRMAENYKVASTILSTAFDGYLNAITDLEVSGIKFAPNDSGVQLTLQYRLSESWIDSVYTKLKAAEKLLRERQWPLATSGYEVWRTHKGGGVCFQSAEKKPRFIDLSERPPRLKIKTGDKGCVRVPIYYSWFSSFDSPTYPDTTFRITKAGKWIGILESEPAQKGILLEKDSSQSPLLVPKDFIVAIYGFSDDGTHSGCQAIELPTPIYLASARWNWPSVKHKRYQLTVPHFSDTFTKTLTISREWFVNEDRSKAIGKFILKPLQLALQRELRDVAVIIKDVESGGATSLGSFTWNTQLTESRAVRQRQRAGAAYCERTKSYVFREWRFR